MNYIPPELGRQKRPVMPKMQLALILAAALLIAVLFYYVPGFLFRPLNPAQQKQIYLMGELISQEAYYEEEELYLPFGLIKERIDPTIQWDEKNKLVIITTGENVFHFTLGFKEGLQNLEPYSFTYPVIQKDGLVYLPADPLKEFYNLQITEDVENSVVRIHNLKQPVQQGKIVKAGKLRHNPSARAPWLAKTVQEETVRVFRENQGWYWIETEDGRMGYIDKMEVELTRIETPVISKNVYPPWNPLKKPVIMTWEYVGQKTANPREIGQLEGVQVVSPTWFHLRDNGLVANNADMKYVKWAQENGRLVWALFDNGFNPDLTHTFLNDAALRLKAIKQIMSFVELYQLDGINIDFENMYLEDKDAFVQFIRELAPLLHDKERTLTVDVTFHSLSETWSMCYDRKRLAEVADYLMVMAYDEHGSGSKVAGSVSSLPWVERGLQRMLEEVPPEKLILGIPFYTRLWTEETDEKGGMKLTSKALSMERADSWVRENRAEVRDDAATGQRYAELKQGNTTYRMWLEDSTSITKRIELMKKYRLAGVAAWRRGFEKEEIWPVLGSLVNKRW